jgi:hypothetical protein
LKILSKLNKYIFVEDLIYKNKFNNITPFYTKKEAIIYLCRLLLNKDENIDLYNDKILYQTLSEILKNYNIKETHYLINDKEYINYLNNERVYTYLNDYISINTFDKEIPVYFSDVLYNPPTNSNYKYPQDQQIVTNILLKQKDIIDLLLTLIVDDIEKYKYFKLNDLEYSFMISYNKMIENRRELIKNRLQSYENDKQREKNQILATQLYMFKKQIPELAAKISHYSCSSPTNFLSMGFKSLVFLPIMGPISIGYMAINCVVSSVTFFTILYIFRK